MIRAFCPGDLEEVLKIWLVANQKAHPFLPERYWREMLPLVRKAIPKATVFVWDEGDGPLGFLGLSGQTVEGLFLSEQAQGKGVGKRLLDCVKQKNNTLTLRVYRKNERALGFYLHEGFRKKENTVDLATGEEELVMEWTQP